MITYYSFIHILGVERKYLNFSIIEDNSMFWFVIGFLNLSDIYFLHDNSTFPSSMVTFSPGFANRFDFVAEFFKKYCKQDE